MGEDHGVWLYAITRASAGQGEWNGSRGVAETPLEAIDEGGLRAVASRVPLAEFGADALRRNLEDLDWLATTARAHDAVISTVGHMGTVIPMRLATVYLDDDRVRSMLSQHDHELRFTLDRLAGRTEWGVKAYRRPGVLVGAATSGATTAGPGAGAVSAGPTDGSGTARPRRRDQLSAQRSADEITARRAQEVHSALTILAADSRRHPPQDPKLTGRREQMALNGSYLVDDSRLDEFASAVAALDDERCGLRLELTGPWPPYSFAGNGETQR